MNLTHFKNVTLFKNKVIIIIIQFSIQTVEQKHVSTLLSNFKKRSCLGSKCLSERGEDGFSKNGKTPWIGYPTIVEVILDIMQLGSFFYEKTIGIFSIWGGLLSDIFSKNQPFRSQDTFFGSPKSRNAKYCFNPLSGGLGSSGACQIVTC